MARQTGAQRRAAQSKNRTNSGLSIGTGPRTRQGRPVGPKDGETKMKEGNLFRFDAKSKTWKPVNKSKPEAKPAAKPADKPVGGLARNWRSRASGSPASADAPPAPAPLRSPAFSAPVHSKPQDFGSAYAPQAGQAPRPNTPQPAANPFAGIGDVRGQQMNPEAANLRDAPVQAGNQEYQGQTFQGIDANGNDMERRRAFLDADNSLDGMKAVRELLNRRKLSISVEN